MIQDAGGVPLAGGARMRTGMIYRISGALARPGEFAALKDKGLRSIVDLRGETEDRNAVIDWAAEHDVDYFNFPIIVGNYASGRYQEIAKAIEEGTHAEWLETTYGQLAIEFGDEFVAAFEQLSRRFPCGFGCAAGKDRTGVMSAYLQVLLGATEETAVQAYLKKAPTLEQMRLHFTKMYDLAPGEELGEGLLHVALARPESMVHAFDTVRERGGVESFLREHGLSDAAIGRLRDALVEHP